MTKGEGVSGNGGIGGIGVLVVEDDDFTRMMLVRLIEDLGPRAVSSAANGDEALTLMSERGADIDVVICDLEMPGRGGLELLHALRSVEGSHDSRLPVIVLTAHRETEVVQQAVLFGVAGYLVKPVSKRELEKRLAVVARGLDGRGGGI